MAIALDEELTTVSAIEFRIYVLKQTGTQESLQRVITLQSKLEQIIKG